MDWCRRHVRWTQRDWQTVLFSDESRFCFNVFDRRKKVWRRRGERFADCCVREVPKFGGGSIMVWSAISWRYRTPLTVVDGNRTALRYVDEVLEPCVIPFLQSHPDVNTFQQDNARHHSANVTQTFLREHNVNVMPWPSFSPDLSPIEHLWDELGRGVYDGRHQINTTQQLVQALREEWVAIPQYRIQRLIRSMRRRCQETLRVNGSSLSSV